MSDKEDYSMERRLGVPYDEAIGKVTAALANEGFGVLTEIDVKSTMKKKLDAEFRRYVILGACNPHLAKRALDTDLGIGLLLPCNIIVYEDGGESVVSIMDPMTMMSVADNRDLVPVAEEAKRKLDNVLASL